jgi:putative DNA primase/helicase
MRISDLQIHGLEESVYPSSSDLPCPEPLANGPESGRQSLLVAADQIKIEAVDWIWRGWLAARKFHILGGAPGTGKTTIALKVASTISTGNHWPDGSLAPKGKVVIWSEEDGIEDTLAPRLKAAGADLSNILFVGEVPDRESRRSFDPGTDMAVLLDELEMHKDLRLLILDPVVTTVTGNSNQNAEVRRALQPLVGLANRTGCSVLGITHLSKGTIGRNPVERITGSLAFGALARIVWVAAKSDSNESQEDRILCRAKSNIGEDSGGFTYELITTEVPGAPEIEASVVNWIAPVEGQARDLLTAREGESSEAGALQDAMSFLAGLLSESPLPVQAIKKEANDAGHSWITIRRASAKLGIESRKDGMRGGWHWYLDRTCSSEDKSAHPF